MTHVSLLLGFFHKNSLRFESKASLQRLPVAQITAFGGLFSQNAVFLALGLTPNACL